ncbi:MAG: hypothetical protein K6A74_03385 [Lachnospiraceae bacterium]|nr:hypothetical protein [Lachnospiraceae bacterium]
MKIIKYVVISILAIVLLCLLPPYTAEASNVIQMKKAWYSTKSFPINPNHPLWRRLDLEDNFTILNPPKDVLNELSSEDLAKLMMKYPHLWVLTSYDYREKDVFWDYLRNNCDIYNEILKREDGIAALLNEYKETDFNASMLNGDPMSVFGYNPKINAEVFGCQFVRRLLASKNMSKADYGLIEEIIKKKSVEYGLLVYNCDVQYLTFEEDQENVEMSLLGRTITVKAKNDGFTATGADLEKTILDIQIRFIPGVYQKYGVSSDCLKWYSGDYDAETRKRYNNRINYSWYRLANATPKYNCHAYAWLKANASSGYWLESPVNYMNSSRVTQVGEPKVNDIIVMYSSAGIAHSAVVCETPSGKTGLYAVSKIGGLALYRSPVSELMNYYSCKTFKKYRIK